MDPRVCADYMVSSQQVVLLFNHPICKPGCVSWTTDNETGEEEPKQQSEHGLASWIKHNRRGHRSPPRERNQRIGSRPLLTWLGKSLVFSRGRDHADPTSPSTWGAPGLGTRDSPDYLVVQQATSQRATLPANRSVIATSPPFAQAASSTVLGPDPSFCALFQTTA